MAKEQKLSIDQGSRFQYVIGITGLALTGLTAKMQIRAGHRNDSTLLLDATEFCSVDVANSQVIIDLPGSATETADWLRARYDIKLYNQGDTSVQPIRVMQGEVVLNQQVTN